VSISPLRLRVLRRFTILYFAAYAVFTMFPGVVRFRGPRPFILGLPLPLVWVSLWIIGGFVVFVLIDHSYRQLDADE
jgi:hypothetical protein